MAAAIARVRAAAAASFSTAGAGARSRQLPKDGKTLADFVGGDGRAGGAGGAGTGAGTGLGASAPLSPTELPQRWLERRSLWVETYGCQMNKADSEVVLSVLADAGMVAADGPTTADVVLLNTCAIREKAEDKVLSRLNYFKNLKVRTKRKGVPASPVVGVLGCMAERLKRQLLESDRLVDVVAGPDAYRDLPRLVGAAGAALAAPGRTGLAGAGLMNVQLSLEETYADVTPVRRAGDVGAFVSITRGAWRCPGRACEARTRPC